MISNIDIKQSDTRHRKLNNYTLNEFRKLVRKSLGHIEYGEETVFYSLPEFIWDNIFQTNFGGDLNYAKTHLLNIDGINPEHRKFEEIEQLSKFIDNYQDSVELIEQALQNKIPIILITDTDNDGSFSQTIARVFCKELSDVENQNFHIEYARAVANNKTRGFTADLVSELLSQYDIDKNDKCLIITADNGINSVNEQLTINRLFPNAQLLITDHHNPEPNMCIQENDNTYVFNPHYQLEKHCNNKELKRNNHLNQKSKDFFNEYNISGASTLGVLLKQIIQNRNPNSNSIEEINQLSKISNMLDYVYTHPAHKPMDSKTIDMSLELQGLLNTVNSMNALITNNLSQETLNVLDKMSNSQIDTTLMIEQNQQAQSLNVMAHLMLSDYMEYQKLSQSDKINFVENGIEKLMSKRLASLIGANLDVSAFTYYSGNPNFIEQLRPIIFELMVNDNKSVYEKDLYEQMVKVFKQLQRSEKVILNELRKLNALQVYEHKNIRIDYLHPELQRIFNRKLFNKAFNRANLGMAITLDGSSEYSISGSFRSNYDISKILTKTAKQTISSKLGIILETPGHERAAGFIIRPKNNKKPFTLEKQHEILTEISDFLNKRIETIKNTPQVKKQNQHEMFLISDLDSLNMLAKINQNVRGMVANFYRITPLIQLNPQTMVSINKKTGEQESLFQIAQEKPLGWTALPVKLSGREDKHETNILIPNAVVEQLYKNEFYDYVQLSYLNNGAFIFEKTLNGMEINELVIGDKVPALYLEKNHKGLLELEKFYDKDISIEQLSNKQLQDLPFFKYNPNGNKDWNSFQAYIIKTLQKSQKDIFSTFDVEAVGFGNAPIFNIGTINYMIDENSGIKIDKQVFDKQTIQYKDKVYFFTANEIQQMFDNQDIIDYHENNSILSITYQGKQYTLNPDKQYGYGKTILDKGLEILTQTVDGNQYIVNQEIIGENISFIIKPDNFIIPATLERLTNISNEFAHKYGKELKYVDDFLYKYYTQQNRSVLFTAHNTGYDARILRANLPKVNELLFSRKNIVGDSAILAKEKQLMYFDTDMITFSGIKGLEGIYFYAPKNADYGLHQMLETQGDSSIQDVTGKYTFFKQTNNLGQEEYFIYHHSSNITNKVNLAIPAEYVKDMKGYEDIDSDTITIKLTDLLARAAYDLFTSKLEIVKTKSKKIALIENQEPKLEWKTQTERAKLAALYWDLPLNKVGYNANGIGQTLSINIFTDWLIKDKKLIKNYLNPNDYSIISTNEQAMNFCYKFMQDYTFEHSRKTNLAKHRFDMPSGFPDKEQENNYYKLMEELEQFSKDFVQINSEISRIYDNRFLYKQILNHFEPKQLSDLNQGNYEHISNQTGIPKEIIQETLTNAYHFQQEYKPFGCQSVLQVEQHNNGVSTGNYAGDMIFEDKAWVLAAIKKLGSVDKAVDLALNATYRFNMQLLGQEQSSELTAIDSMSFKQQDTYSNRDTKTNLINVLENRQDAMIKPTDYQVINFKLNEYTLDAGKEIYAISKPNIVLTQEQLNKDAESLNFLMKVQQIGLANKWGVDTVFNCNLEKLQALKDDLQTRYAYIEMNESKAYIDKYKKEVISTLENIDGIEKLKKNAAVTPSTRSNGAKITQHISMNHLENIEKIIQYKLIQNCNQLLLENNHAASTIRHDMNKLQEFLDGKSSDESLSKIKTSIVKQIVHELKILNEIPNKTINEFESSYKVKRLQDFNFDKIQLHNNSLLDIPLKVLMLNKMAMFDKKHTYPCQLDNVLNTLQNNKTMKWETDSTNIIYDNNFLNINGSKINRQDASEWLMNKFNYVELGNKAIQDYYITGNKPLISLSLENQLELPEEEIIIVKKDKKKL